MPLYCYVFRQGGRDQGFLFERASNAALFAVCDLPEHRAESLRMEKDGALLWSPELIQRIYAACRADLVACPHAVPPALERLAAREGRACSSGAGQVSRALFG